MEPPRDVLCGASLPKSQHTDRLSQRIQLLSGIARRKTQTISPLSCLLRKSTRTSSENEFSFTDFFDALHERIAESVRCLPTR